jgi:plastocyanin
MKISAATTRRRAGTKEVLILAAALLVVLALGVFVASCGGSTASTTVSTPGTTAGGGAGGAQVVMKNTAFDPATVTIKAGESVTWTNQDSMNHTVVADNGEFKSSDLGQGAIFSFKFDKAGTYPYNCSIHPSMKATVVVQ